MIQKGTVQNIDGPLAYLAVTPPVGSCCKGEGASQSGCCSAKTVTLKVEIPQEVAVEEGDQVEISPPEKGAFLSFVRIFLIPAGFFILAFLLTPYFWSEVKGFWPSLFGIIAFILALGVNFLFPKHSSRPKITKVLPKSMNFTPLKNGPTG